MIFPSDISRDEVNRLPLGWYKGPIVLVDAWQDLKTALKEAQAAKLVGFDTETKPTFRRGNYNPVALLQLALPGKVYLIRLNKLGFPPPLQQLFKNPQLMKVGISIRDDMQELQKLADFDPRSVVELNDVAKDLGVVREGVRNLTATFLGFRISKSQQTTNWEREDLTDKQLRYAATDAWVCREIYSKLQRLGFIDR